MIYQQTNNRAVSSNNKMRLAIAILSLVLCVFSSKVTKSREIWIDGDNETRAHPLYVQYLLYHDLKHNGDSVYLFCRDFLQALLKKTERIDEVLKEGKHLSRNGKPVTEEQRAAFQEGIEVLKGKRKIFKSSCSESLVLTCYWIKENFDKIHKNEKVVTDTTMLALWEAFRKHPCARSVDYDKPTFGPHFQAAFAIDPATPTPTKYDKREELLRHYEQVLAEPMKMVMARLSMAEISDHDKLILAVYSKNNDGRSFRHSEDDRDKAGILERYIRENDFGERSALTLAGKTPEEPEVEIPKIVITDADLDSPTPKPTK